MQVFDGGFGGTQGQGSPKTPGLGIWNYEGFTLAGL